MRHSSSACVLLPAACAAVVAVTVLHAGGPIEWAKDIKLTQQDFRRKVPASSTDTAHSWVGLDVVWECRDGKAIAHARAVFDPDQSWWRGSVPALWGGLDGGLSRTQLENRRTAAERDADLLRHEQLHFDLTELAARRIRRRLEGLVCANPASERDLAAAISEIERSWNVEQARYDKETDHGANLPTQRQWEARVRRALD